jgi:sugar phosphate isomerase/epimerase
VTKLPILALSVPWQTYPQRFDWVAEQGFGLTYAPNPEAFDTLAGHLDPYLARGVPVRYHGFFMGYEIGHQDRAAAEKGLGVHLAALEAMAGRGEQVLTVHIGLIKDDPIDAGRAEENLGRLAARGRELGITVCLENLRQGITSDPERVHGWAEATGAMLTLDVGHMLSCRRVQEGSIAALDFVEIFAGRLVEVHMYERETDRHYPPRNMEVLGPIVDRLLNTGCGWWTIELVDYAEVLVTRALLLEYLSGPGSREEVDRSRD